MSETSNEMAHVTAGDAFVRAVAFIGFNTFLGGGGRFIAICLTEKKFYASMGGICIPGTVFGLTITVYSMHSKPANHLNVACFLLICDGSDIHCSK